MFLVPLTGLRRRVQRSGVGVRSGTVLLTEMGSGKEGGSSFSVNFEIAFVFVTAASLLGKAF